jgi:uncharacterized protein YecE (DUF72 family)
MIRIGTAGWSIPRAHAGLFGKGDSLLARYATRFNATEINTTFYRPHKPGTFARWADTVPRDFRFAVKLPRTITHFKRLQDVRTELDAFLASIDPLGKKLGPLLVQLPPSFAFDAARVRRFAKLLRARHDGAVAWEPRHASWFTGKADALLSEYRMARVGADPAVVPAAAEPGGVRNFTYRRLHGAPHLYRSSYPPDVVDALATKLPRRGEHWVIFDNTMLGHATANAAALQKKLG